MNTLSGLHVVIRTDHVDHVWMGMSKLKSSFLRVHVSRVHYNLHGSDLLDQFDNIEFFIHSTLPLVHDLVMLNTIEAAVTTAIAGFSVAAHDVPHKVTYHHAESFGVIDSCNSMEVDLILHLMRELSHDWIVYQFHRSTSSFGWSRLPCLLTIDLLSF